MAEEGANKTETWSSDVKLRPDALQRLCTVMAAFPFRLLGSKDKATISGIQDDQRRAIIKALNVCAAVTTENGRWCNELRTQLKAGSATAHATKWQGKLCAFAAAWRGTAATSVTVGGCHRRHGRC